MDLIVKSKIEPKIEFLPIENLTKITCPRNSEGTININYPMSIFFNY